MENQSRFLHLADVEIYQRYASKFGMSTAREYLDAQNPKSMNAAAQQIDKGLEPYLLNRDAITDGTHEFVAVVDVHKALTMNGLVRLGTNGPDVNVTPDTVLVWK